jgi:hypothetical protein
LQRRLRQRLRPVCCRQALARAVIDARTEERTGARKCLTTDVKRPRGADCVMAAKCQTDPYTAPACHCV